MSKLPAQLQPFAEALDGFVRERVDGILKGLQARLDGIEKDQESLGRIKRPHDPDESQLQVDEIWGCKKCGARLGFYDTTADVLRVRYKEQIVHVHVGVGGWITVLCRGCAEVNEIAYVPPKGCDPVEGGIRLTAAALRELLKLAEAHPDQAVTIPVEPLG